MTVLQGWGPAPQAVAGLAPTRHMIKEFLTRRHSGLLDKGLVTSRRLDNGWSGIGRSGTANSQGT